jgi:hypothetical protein
VSSSQNLVPAWSRLDPFDFSTNLSTNFSTNPSEPSPSDNRLHSRLSVTIRVCYSNMIRRLADSFP